MPNPIYTFYDFGYLGLAPLRVGAELLRDAFQSPFNPASFTGPGRAMAAASDVTFRMLRRFEQPAFGLETTVVGGHEYAVHEHDVMDLPFCRLKHFAVSNAPKRPKLLVGAPLSGHYATLLRGTVEALLPHHDVYITDWKNARDVPLAHGYFDLDDCIDYYMQFLKHLGPDTHVLGVCQPSVPILMAVALLNKLDKAAAPRSMVLMGGPVDTRVNPTEVNKLAMQHDIAWFEEKAVSTVPPWYAGTMRPVYPGFLQLTGFMSMNLDRHIDSYFDYFTQLVKGNGESAEKHRAFYNEYLAVMDIPAEFYIQTVERVFQQHLLPRGKFMWHGHRVDLGDITDTALLCIEGELDDISAAGQTAAALPLCRNLPDIMKRAHVQKKAGHYGLFSGTRWREEVRPRLTAFMTEFDTDKPRKRAARKPDRIIRKRPKPLKKPLTLPVVTAAIIA